tara:strand:+ start:551 stop:1126 length:576 start_codon:yes stop_codon:yes gene_type:complete
MIKIGILGDIGSGKTFISKKFSFPIFNADDEVNKIYKKNKNCYKKLKKIFPNYILSFPVKKEELMKAICYNKNNIKKINQIVHPIVRKNLNKFLLKNKGKKAVILDIPLLLENKIKIKNLILVFVDANRNNILKKLKKRKNFNIKIFNILKKTQFSNNFKKDKANFIIKNNFKKKKIKEKINLLKEKIFNK